MEVLEERYVEVGESRTTSYRWPRIAMVAIGEMAELVSRRGSRWRGIATDHIRQCERVRIEPVAVVPLIARQIRIADDPGPKTITASGEIGIGPAGELQIAAAHEGIGIAAVPE